jgi:hypothetical protein
LVSGSPNLFWVPALDVAQKQFRRASFHNNEQALSQQKPPHTPYIYKGLALYFVVPYTTIIALNLIGYSYDKNDKYR